MDSMSTVHSELLWMVEKAGKMTEGLAWTFGVTLVVCILGAVVYMLKGQKKRKDGMNAPATTHSNNDKDNKQMEA